MQQRMSFLFVFEFRYFAPFAIYLLLTFQVQTFILTSFCQKINGSLSLNHQDF